MSEFNCIFLGREVDRSPELSEYAESFLNYSAAEWNRGGGDCVFSYIEDGLSLAVLVVLHDGKGRMSVRYDLARARKAYYSIGSKDEMNTIVDVGDDQFVPLGSLVSPLTAWHAVEDFFVRPLEMPGRLHWMNAEEIVWPE